MPRLVEQLTEARIRALAAPGLYPDGRGLYLQVRPGGARSWIYRFTLNGRTRDMGLGSLVSVGLVKARAKANAARALRDEGIDPIEHAAAQAPAPVRQHFTETVTFEQAAEAYMADSLKRMRNKVHRHQWHQTLQDFAFPVIGPMAVDEIGTNDVLAVLRPIWETRCETAMRLRGRIERILARATVEGKRTGSNPATWRGHLKEALPGRSKVQPVQHHPAMEYSDVPAFMVDLCRREEVAAVALRFLILTAARTSEVRGARWDEINLTDATWIIPPDRTKTGVEHIVPLSTGALATLREIEPLRDLSRGIIFPGRQGEALSQLALLLVLKRRMKRGVTVHGFRSTFRDWAGDEGNVPRELAEASLAHVLQSTTERAYRRKTAVERRRVVMQAWCDFCLPPADVVDFAEAKGRKSVAA